jgi:ABC-2 type transport system permease protein
MQQHSFSKEVIGHNGKRQSFNAILIKEIRHIFRDKKTLAFMLFIPVVLVLIFGYAIRTEIYQAQIAVWDCSKSTHSKSLINKFIHSDYFNVTQFLNSQTEVEQSFRQAKVRMVMVIPKRFDEDITIKKHARIQLITDASDLNISATLTGYAKQIIAQYQQSLQVHSSSSSDGNPVEIRVQMRYNPDMESAYMFVPGNIALIMILITSLMAAIAIAGEQETGSWKMLIISPAHQLVILAGKILPYMFLSLICTGIVILLGVLIFGMPIKGNIALLV